MLGSLILVTTILNVSLSLGKGYNNIALLLTQGYIILPREKVFYFRVVRSYVAMYSSATCRVSE